MQIHGLESIRSDLEADGFFVKLLANEKSAIFFPRSIQHRDAGAFGLNFEDDSKGNAIAATVVSGRIDFRRHHDFSAERVKAIADMIIRSPDVQFASGFSATYQGRVLIQGEE